jgi:hypothetical protein
LVITNDADVSYVSAPLNVSELIQKKKKLLFEKVKKKSQKEKDIQNTEGGLQDDDDDLDILGENISMIIRSKQQDPAFLTSDFVIDVGMSNYSTFILLSSGKVLACGEGSNIINVYDTGPIIEQTLPANRFQSPARSCSMASVGDGGSPGQLKGRSASPSKFASSVYFPPSVLPKPSLLLYKGSSLVDVSDSIIDTINSEIEIDEVEEDEDFGGEEEKIEIRTVKILSGRCYVALLIV